MCTRFATIPAMLRHDDIPLFFARRVAFAALLGAVPAVALAWIRPVDRAAGSRRALHRRAGRRAARRSIGSRAPSCHGADADRRHAPSLTGPAFEASWSDPRVTLADDLFFLARTSMPPRASSALSAQEHAAVFAYILKVNGFPSGPTPLTAASEQLEAAHLRPRRRPRPRRARAAGVRAGCGRRRARIERTGSGHAHRRGAIDRLAVPHATTTPARDSRRSTDINSANAARLAPACMFQVGERDNFQTGPIVDNGTMYVTTMTARSRSTRRPAGQVASRAGQPRTTGGSARNRGVAIKDGRVVRARRRLPHRAQRRNRRAAVGATRRDSGRGRDVHDGAADLRGSRADRARRAARTTCKGWVGAFRAADGSPVWRFNTVPKPGEPGSETWKNPKGIPDRRRVGLDDVRARHRQRAIMHVAGHQSGARSPGPPPSGRQPLHQLDCRARRPHRQAALAPAARAQRLARLGRDPRDADLHHDGQRRAAPV